MNGLETAIRGALERSDRTNAEMRARIYQSARQALEAGLRKQNVDDPQVVTEQRHRLEAVIHAIELEERDRLGHAAAAAAPAQPSPDVGPDIPPEVHMVAPRAPAAAAAPPQAPDDMLVGGVRRDAEPDAPEFNDFGAARDDRHLGDVFAADRPQERAAGMQPLDIRPEGAPRRAKRRRGLFSRLFIFVVLFASLGMGGWWVYTSGLLLTATERDTSVPNPPPHAEAEDFTGDLTQNALDPQQGFSEDWIEVFEPGQIASIDAHPNATVDVQPASEGTAVRIISKSADADGNVVIAIPVTAMRELAGRTSTIALTMQSVSDKPVQISVECNFDRLGDCARHRFTVNPEKSDVLFRVSFERSIAPSSPGELILNSDLSGKGQGVNLYSVRVLPGQ